MNEFTAINYIIVLIAMLMVYKISMKFLDTMRHKNDMELMKFQITTEINSDIMDLFDNFLSDCFDDYILDHPEYVDAVYLTSQQELSVRNDMINLVGDRISPFLYQKLSLYYNEEVLPDIIARRVYHLVTAYAINKNTPKQSKEEL